MMKKKRKPDHKCVGSACGINSAWRPQRRELRAQFDARPDPVDFRDRLYVPTLVEVPPEVPLEKYRAHQIPILNQGHEGACTGFALATIAHFLLRTRKVCPDETLVSARMFYELAKRYDPFPGEDYDGSTARGAIKAWFKHGVCPEELWRSDSVEADSRLTLERAEAARRFPLGAYFRVDAKDIVAMHSALSEVGVLYVTASVHRGWMAVNEDGIVTQSQEIIGGHAFVLVGYDSAGFWLQNSWGDSWGKDGFGHISYDDWLANGNDVWAVRLGVEINSSASISNRDQRLSGAGLGALYCQLRPHVITACNDGKPCTMGLFANDSRDIEEIFTQHFPRITAKWKTKRLMFFAHGGLVHEASALQRISAWRTALLDQEIYPIIFIWNTDLLSTVKNIIEDALSLPPLSGRTSGALLGSEVVDDILEPFARLVGKRSWDEMKQNAYGATTNLNGVVRMMAPYLRSLCSQESVELHFVGHSAGAIFLSLFMQLICTAGVITDGPLEGRIGYALPAKTVTLWAPACTKRLFQETYCRLLEENRIEQLALFILDEFTEQSDNCLQLYQKSLLYLVSNALEETPHSIMPGKRFSDGTALLGLHKFVKRDSQIQRLIDANAVDVVLCPNGSPCGSSSASQARHHGAFDEDRHTLLATMARILGVHQLEPGSRSQFLMRAFRVNPRI